MDLGGMYRLCKGSWETSLEMEKESGIPYLDPKSM